jgi:hypothetical protein
MTEKVILYSTDSRARRWLSVVSVVKKPILSFGVLYVEVSTAKSIGSLKLTTASGPVEGAVDDIRLPAQMKYASNSALKPL